MVFSAQMEILCISLYLTLCSFILLFGRLVIFIYFVFVLFLPTFSTSFFFIFVLIFILLLSLYAALFSQVIFSVDCSISSFFQRKNWSFLFQYKFKERQLRRWLLKCLYLKYSEYSMCDAPITRVSSWFTVYSCWSWTSTWYFSRHPEVTSRS